MPKAIKKLNPKNFTQDAYNKRVIDGMADGTIRPGYYPPELRPKGLVIPKAKVVAEAPKVETPKAK